jgi:hypothetical protein
MEGFQFKQTLIEVRDKLGDIEQGSPSINGIVLVRTDEITEETTPPF